jgi:hypothetical protein
MSVLPITRGVSHRKLVLGTWVNNLAIKSASYGECNGSGDIVEMGY